MYAEITHYSHCRVSANWTQLTTMNGMVGRVKTPDETSSEILREVHSHGGQGTAWLQACKDESRQEAGWYHS